MLRLLTYNIRRGGAGREEALLETIAACAPDIVVFQEATEPDVIKRLASAMSMAHCGAMPRYSLGFMSRIRMARVEWHRPRVSRHAFLELVPEGIEVRIFGVHLSAVFAAITERRRVFELRALLRSIAHHQHGFHALAGDFNTVAPGELLDVGALPRRVRAAMWVSGGHVRWRTIQIVLDAGYVDAFRTRHPADPGLTLPAAHPQVRLDYVFLPSTHAARLKSCDVIRSEAAQTASDHLPLLATLDVS
jgi:endonuclease/exonuclease/phosphatase family metal-dependent hydrolase